MDLTLDLLDKTRKAQSTMEMTKDMMKLELLSVLMKTEENSDGMKLDSLWRLV